MNRPRKSFCVVVFFGGGIMTQKVAYVVNIVVRSYATTVYLQCIFERCPFRLGVTLAAEWIDHWLLGWNVNLADVVLVASDVLLQ